jgi:hypothetical protein
VPVHPGPPPPTRADITDTWVGATSTRAYRLRLLPDGTARLATIDSTFGPQVHVYHAGAWSLNGHELSADFEPVQGAAQPVYVRAHASRGGLQVSVSLSPTSPLPTVPFARESQLDEQLNLLRAADDLAVTPD